MAKINFKPAQPSTPYDIAHSYLADGVPVFPCREETTWGEDPNTSDWVEWKEKAPYTSNGLNGATRSERIVRIWWQERYPNAAIGVPTGAPLGAWVLDLDRHTDDDGTVRDGHLWLAEMEAKHGPLPKSARATTANGGTHIMFKHVDGVRNRAAIAPGVDTRGTGGYILAPGSVMADGRRYEWVDWFGVGTPEFPEAPQWLLDLVIPKAAPAVRTEYTYRPGNNEPYIESAIKAECDRVATAAQGNRGQQLYSSACALGELVAAGALTREAAESELYRAAGSSGVLQKDGERATMDRIRRGLDKTRNSPREIPERTARNDNTPLVDTSTMIENAKKKKAEPTKVEEPAVEQDAAPQQPKKRERFERTWFDNIIEGEPKETFVKGVLGVGEFTTVSGLPGTGKSVIVTDIACHVAADREWHGRRVKPGLVVYVAAERKKLTERRMMAFRKKHGVHDVPLLVIGGRLDLTRNLDDARALIAEIKNAELETSLKCVWVILDTLTRVFGAGDQNASKDMTKFVQSVDEIMAETNAHVTAIHHTAWSGERGKGAIDLDGAVDASFMVKKANGKFQLVCDGTNDGDEGDVLTFAMESVEIGRDEDGEPTTAPVVVTAVSDSVLAKGVLEAKSHKDRALAILAELIEDVGVPSTGQYGFPSEGKIAPTETWRQAFYDDMGDATQPHKQATFNRVKKKVLAEGKAGECGLWAWVIK